jgi:CHASE2 domain-containing sensor protein
LLLALLVWSDAGKPLPGLKGKIVLVGVTDPLLGDHHSTIYSGSV